MPLKGGGNALAVAVESFGLLRTDEQFREYVIVRIMLLSVALVLPFYVLLAQQYTGGSVGGLGMMIIASGLAGSLTAPVWGRLGDRSSRNVIISLWGDRRADMVAGYNRSHLYASLADIRIVVSCCIGLS